MVQEAEQSTAGRHTKVVHDRSPGTCAVVFAALAVVLQGCGAPKAEAQDGAFSKGDADVFVVRQGDATHRLKLNVTIAGWKVSCSRSRAVVWGQTRSDLPIGTPPYASVYILDLQRPKVIGELTTSRGPFDVDFTRDNRFIVVDESVIDFATGQVTSIELPPAFKVEPESCADFPGKSLMWSHPSPPFASTINGLIRLPGEQGAGGILNYPLLRVTLGYPQIAGLWDMNSSVHANWIRWSRCQTC